MNIIQQQQVRRDSIINSIAKSVEKCWERSSENATQPNRNKLILEICREFGCSDRKAKEYLKSALFLINGVIEKESGLIFKDEDYRESERILRTNDDRTDKEGLAKSN